MLDKIEKKGENQKEGEDRIESLDKKIDLFMNILCFSLLMFACVYTLVKYF